MNTCLIEFEIPKVSLAVGFPLLRYRVSVRSVELIRTWSLPINVKLHWKKERVCLSGNFSDGGDCVVSTFPVRGSLNFLVGNWETFRQAIPYMYNTHIIYMYIYIMQLLLYVRSIQTKGYLCQCNLRTYTDALDPQNISRAGDLLE